jgi:glutathione S-transferase
MTMKLFYAAPSPFARKVRIVARERNLMGRMEEISVNLLHDDPRLLAANPGGLVPALILTDGTPLIDSPLIAHYLDTVGTGPHLIPDDETRWQVLHHEALADALMDFAVAGVYEKRRTDAPPSQAFIDRKLAKIIRCIASLPDKSASNAETFTLGDIATACALGYLDFRYPDTDWRAQRLNWRVQRPDLAEWFATIKTRPAFQETRPTEHTR